MSPIVLAGLITAHSSINGNMFFLYALVSCIPLAFVSEGRTVFGILGGNVSLSWTFDYSKKDSMSISRNLSHLLMVWPLENHTVWYAKDDRFQVYVEKSTYETMTVTVKISRIRKQDTGIYKLERRWNLEDMDDYIILNVFDEEIIPKITQHSVLDLNLALQCRISTTPTGKFLWKVNGSLIENIGRHFQNDTVLFIRNLTVDDQYNLYECRESGSDVYSDLYKIKISGPNTITFAPNIKMIHEYSRLSLPCFTNCYPTCSWKWTKFGASSGGEKVISSEDVLYFHNVTRQDAGNYACKVQNKLTGVSLENFTSLEIVYGPDELLFNLSNKQIELDETDSIVISCYADCFPPCQFDWIDSHAKPWIRSAELKLVNVKRDSNYTCRAMNPGKDNITISDTIYVIVKSESGYHPSSTETTQEDDNKDSDMSKLVYIIVGLGCTLVAALCIPCLRKLRKMHTYRRTIEQHSITFTTRAVENEYI